jgi:hypothetical protein
MNVNKQRVVYAFNRGHGSKTKKAISEYQEPNLYQCPVANAFRSRCHHHAGSPLGQTAEWLMAGVFAVSGLFVRSLRFVMAPLIQTTDTVC